MIPLTFQEVASLTGGAIQQGRPSQPMGRLSLDTRTLQPGEVFLAFKGSRHDGHNFLEVACQRGAQGLIVDRWPAQAALTRYQGVVLRVPATLTALQGMARAVRQRVQATIIGISGSNGKTTTKDMLGAILTPLASTLVAQGNLNNQIGLPLTVLDLSPEHRFGVLELGVSSREEMQRLIEIAAPTIGVLTNIGKAHLAGFGSVAGVFAAKRLLWDALPSAGCAVVNLDDPWLSPLTTQLACRIITFGERPDAQVRGTDVEETAEGLHVTLTIERASARVMLATLGRFQTQNALAAAATAHAVAVPLPQIVQGLQRFQPPAMRMQRILTQGGAMLVNDAYNANPSSMRVAIQDFCRAFADRERYLVLGDMLELGVESTKEHETLGAWLAEFPLAGLFVMGAEAEAIVQGALTAGMSSDRMFVARTPEQLVKHVRSHLTPAVAVLFKASRGMRLETAVNRLVPLSN